MTYPNPSASPVEPPAGELCKRCGFILPHGPNGCRIFPQDSRPQGMTLAQYDALVRLHERFRHDFIPSGFAPAFDLPQGWFAGWCGPADRQGSIYVGVDPSGGINS